MRTHRPALLGVIGVAVFVVLTALVAVGALDGIDGAVARFAARHQTSAGVTTARVVTDVLSPGVDAAALLLGSAVIAWRQRWLRPLLLAVAVLVVVSTLVLELKIAIDRPLPHSHGHPDRGFPSGHTAATLCFLGTLARLASNRSGRLRRRLLAVVAVLSALLVVALVSAGFHWLTDTLASLGLGCAVLAALVILDTDAVSGGQRPPPADRSAPSSAQPDTA
jgi:membrane-associated phospholipid phosphatase